jgi:hypothetical protein
MTLAFSFGPWGGFYLHTGYTFRICLGWVAITFLPVDFDYLLEISMLDPAIITALYRVADCAAAITETAYHDDTEDPTRRTIGEADYIALHNALAVLEALEAAAKQEVQE